MPSVLRCWIFLWFGVIVGLMLGKGEEPTGCLCHTLLYAWVISLLRACCDDEPRRAAGMWSMHT